MSKRKLLAALKKAREAKSISLEEYDEAVDELMTESPTVQNSDNEQPDPHQKPSDLESAIDQDIKDKEALANIEQAVSFLHGFDSFFEKHGKSLGAEKEEFTKFLKFGKDKPEQAKILKQQVIKAFFKNSENYQHATDEQKAFAESVLNSNDDSLDLTRSWDLMQSNLNINARLAEQAGGSDDTMDSSKTIPNVHNFFASNQEADK